MIPPRSHQGMARTHGFQPKQGDHGQAHQVRVRVRGSRGRQRASRVHDRGAHDHRPSGAARAGRPGGHLRLDPGGIVSTGGPMSATAATATPTVVPAFDPARYKTTTTDQWQAAAAAWYGWGAVIDTWLGEATDVMLDLAQVGPGSTVLDVAAGAGGQSIAAARRVGPTGRVLATDIAPNLLAYADHAARTAGLAAFVATRVMDGENLEVEPGHFTLLCPGSASSTSQTRRVP